MPNPHAGFSPRWRPHRASTLVSSMVALAAIVFASSAHAGPGGGTLPEPRFCIVDHVAIASWSGAAALAGVAPCSAAATPGFDVLVRNVDGVPLGGEDLVLKLASPGANLAVYASQSPGVTVNCVDHTLHATTNAAGAVHFVPRFGRYAESAVVEVWCHFVKIATIEARSPDYDGDGTVGLPDFNTFVTDYMGSPRPRSDFNDCPGVTLADFTFFSGEYMASQGQPAEAICP